MKDIELTEYTVETEKLPTDFKGFRFILLSDLHSNSYGVNLHKLNEIIKKARPDAVLVAGDMFNNHVKDSIIDVGNYLAILAKHFPVFYGIGNHEYTMKMEPETFGDRFEEIRQYLSDAGVVFLEDETVTLEKGNASVLLSGVEIDGAFYKRVDAPVMGNGLMDKHLGTADISMYNILIAHNPDYFHRYAEWGADLVLSGHIHGGMIRIPKIGGIVSPKVLGRPKYDSGVYDYEDSLMIVSRGLGTHTINVRVNNRPEAVCINILPKLGI